MTRLIAVALLLASTAGYSAVHVAQATQAQGAIARALFLIGDAGEPRRGGEPVLVALRRQVERFGDRATVAFLGDNLYPRGLPDAADPDFAEMARRLDDQVDAVKDTGARVIFIPGNHDWVKGRAEGLAAVRRQEQRAEGRGDPPGSFLPNDGCPGPAIVDGGPRLRLVVLDTHWWPHPHERPEGPGAHR